MNTALLTPRSEVATYAPRIETMRILPGKVRDLIGPGGKVIREIVDTTGAKIEVDDAGTVKIASADPAAMQAALDRIRAIVAEPEAGRIYEGRVVKTADFGAFVNFFGPRDGLVHVSELAAGRVAKVTDVVKEGDRVRVKFLGMDERGKLRLSMKSVDQDTGEDIGHKGVAEPTDAVQ